MVTGKLSFSKKIKNSVKSAVKFINNFEKIVSEIAISKNYDYVVCGHIHHPEIKLIQNKSGVTTYLNSGDWIENLTSLEYQNKTWSLYEYEKDEIAKNIHKNTKFHDVDFINTETSTTKLFEELLKEFNIN